MNSNCLSGPFRHFYTRLYVGALAQLRIAIGLLHINRNNDDENHFANKH